MSEPFSEYEPAEIPTRDRPPLGLWAALAAVLLTLLAAGGYAIHEHGLASQLSAQNAQIAASLNATRGQIDALTAKLDALSAPTSEKPAAALSATKPAHKTHRSRAEEARWKQIQAELAEHSKQIQSTQQDLANTRTDLQGSIARTHDELTLLEKKGERNYYEFDLDKSGQFQRQGPVGIRLRKANTKHEYTDLELMVDDYKLTKKHVNIYEPVVFYAADGGRPVELVINSVSKNHIHGYVSEPKYGKSELDSLAANASGSAQNASATSTNSAPAAPRQRLQLPKTSSPN